MEPHQGRHKVGGARWPGYRKCGSLGEAADGAYRNLPVLLSQICLDIFQRHQCTLPTVKAKAISKMATDTEALLTLGVTSLAT